MPTALRRKPHEFLVGGETEILVEPGRMVPHQSNQLLVYCPDAFGSASQGLGLSARQDHTLEAKAWLTIEPGVVEYTGVIESTSKIGISGQCVVYHRSNNIGRKQRRGHIGCRFQEPGSDVFIVRDFTVQQTVAPVHRAPQEEPLYDHLTHGVKHQRQQQGQQKAPKGTEETGYCPRHGPAHDEPNSDQQPGQGQGCGNIPAAISSTS